MSRVAAAERLVQRVADVRAARAERLKELKKEFAEKRKERTERLSVLFSIFGAKRVERTEKIKAIKKRAHELIKQFRNVREEVRNILLKIKK
ncbi:hypothetical protein [Calderihabitans maritimus]|uniref:Uncharacterized protein n=1 Tax=Calderihabitans maritimus TaxID=1246530 RepID=A0A1Z5HWS5_9FIRM|nr:hypothetical protein [Calderihabitans maritimus]GAW93964.1 hypothetical protein KKC1_30840 [Calderihabitans maritimus]